MVLTFLWKLVILVFSNSCKKSSFFQLFFIMKTIQGIESFISKKVQLIFKLSIFTNVKNSWLSLMVLTNWLLNLFYSTNEVCNVYSRMCIQNIFKFNTIFCHIFFAPKCGHVKGSHSHINVLVSTHWGTLRFGIHSKPIKKRIALYHSLRLIFKLTKQFLFFFKKMNLFYNYKIAKFSIIYYDIVIWVVKLFKV
jgi:hypothetical protein